MCNLGSVNATVDCSPNLRDSCPSGARAGSSIPVKMSAGGLRDSYLWPDITGLLGKAYVLLWLTQLAIRSRANLEPDRSLGIDGGECVHALHIENAIARQR
jgi:hypothetical protein